MRLSHAIPKRFETMCTHGSSAQWDQLCCRGLRKIAERSRQMQQRSQGHDRGSGYLEVSDHDESPLVPHSRDVNRSKQLVGRVRLLPSLLSFSFPLLGGRIELLLIEALRTTL